MLMTYDRLACEDLQGSTPADYLVALDGRFTLVVKDMTILDEPGFPVVELARSLAQWLNDSESDDFEFDSMSYEEPGTVYLRQKEVGWTVGSTFASESTSAIVTWREIEQCCRSFIAAVEADLSRLGISPDRALRHGVIDG